jgi:hypothetical protein
VLISGSKNARMQVQAGKSGESLLILVSVQVAGMIARMIEERAQVYRGARHSAASQISLEAIEFSKNSRVAEAM